MLPRGNSFFRIVVNENSFMSFDSSFSSDCQRYGPFIVSEITSGISRHCSSKQKLCIAMLWTARVIDQMAYPLVAFWIKRSFQSRRNICPCTHQFLVLLRYRPYLLRAGLRKVPLERVLERHPFDNHFRLNFAELFAFWRGA
jgi:hypothetical protein